MEDSSAEMVCVLKISNQCGDCKRKVMMVLRRIRGVYHIAIDGEDGTVKVTGRVNPNTLLSVLERYGKHAEVKYVKFDGEVVERNPTYSYYGDYSNAYDPRCNNSSYPPPQLVAQQQWFVPYQQFYQQPQPQPQPPPQAMYSYPYAPPLQHCSPQGLFWAPQQPPPQSHPYGYVLTPPPNNFAATPHPYGYGPQPHPRPPPPNNFPMGETSSQNRENQCAIM